MTKDNNHINMLGLTFLFHQDDASHQVKTIWIQSIIYQTILHGSE